MADFIISAGIVLTKVAATALIFASCMAIYMVESRRKEA